MQNVIKSVSKVTYYYFWLKMLETQRVENKHVCSFDYALEIWNYIQQELPQRGSETQNYM